MFGKLITNITNNIKLKLHMYFNNWFNNYVASDEQFNCSSRQFLIMAQQRIKTDWGKRCSEYCYGCGTCGAYHALDILELLYDTNREVGPYNTHLHDRLLPFKDELFYLLSPLINDVSKELEIRVNQQKEDVDTLDAEN